MPSHQRFSIGRVGNSTSHLWSRCFRFAAHCAAAQAAGVNPLTGASSALIAPTVNAHYMNEHLRFIGREAGPDVHAVLVLDRAGWHVAKALKVPENITLLHLPPYSPELNGSERIWGFMRSHYLSNRVFKDYEDLFQSITRAWNSLDAQRLKSLTRVEWIERAA